MKWPFSIEYYINKAKKNGYSNSQIKDVLCNEHLWHKVMVDGKPFNKMFEFFLELSKNPTQQARVKDLKVVYKNQRSRLI